ncbi:hypothetical protein FQ154_06130 [Paeniglutamicibacter gangotriensis]|uniref:Uncharacterized protein n=1 Tax=Paeniglutamicibacter gangotriensis TaxID=254787 RepID=A0A5B0EI11_9MICC|nr:hypothetical protein [Paeniglutamicibacter gangotriensis]KAA0977835.1 hypothetical protein FQ154_06130 [Paeniglutamicibacter gangotriensis]
MIGAFTAIGSGLAISAALIYLLLRFLVAEPRASQATAAISRHAFWTALIALFASGTSGLTNLWVNPGENLLLETGNASASVPTLIMHAAAPGLWLGIVYILGQFTWPRHLKPVRSASLQVRSIKTAIPKFLAGFLLLSTILSTALVIVAWTDAGAPDRAGNDPSASMGLPIYDGGTDGYGNPVDEDGYVLDLDDPGQYITRAEADAAENEPLITPISGTRPGEEVGPYLLGGLGLVLLGSLAAATTVIRRPPLDSLDAQDNAVLREIWINRLLRTTIWVVTGFGMASLNYISEGIRARADWGLPVGDSGSVPSSIGLDYANAFQGGATLWMLLVLVLIVAFGPPKLAASASFTGLRPGAPSAAFSKARDFLLLAQGASIIAVMMLAMVPAWTSYSSSDVQLHRDELASHALTLLLVIGGYFLLQALAAWIVSHRLGGSIAPEQPRTGLLPTWFVVVLCLAAATGVASIATALIKGPPALTSGASWLLGILLLTAALARALYRLAARRPMLRGADAREDHELRVLVAQRGARTFGGASLFTAGLLANPSFWAPTDFDYVSDPYLGFESSGLQLICLVLGVVLFLLPAATAYRTPRPQSPARTPSNH